MEASGADDGGAGDGDGEGEGKEGDGGPTGGMSGAAAEVLLDDIQRLRRRVNQLATTLKHAGLAVPLPVRRGSSKKEDEEGEGSDGEDSQGASKHADKGASRLSEDSPQVRMLRGTVNRLLLPALGQLQSLQHSAAGSGEDRVSTRPGGWFGSTVQRIEGALGKAPKRSRLAGLGSDGEDFAVSASSALTELGEALAACERASDGARQARWKCLVLARLALSQAGESGDAMDREDAVTDAQQQAPPPAAAMKVLE